MRSCPVRKFEQETQVPPIIDAVRSTYPVDEAMALVPLAFGTDPFDRAIRFKLAGERLGLYGHGSWRPIMTRSLLIVAATGGCIACLGVAGLLAPALALLLALPVGVACTFLAAVAGAAMGKFLGVGAGLLVLASQVAGLLATASLARTLAQAFQGLG